jgi:hypothetical protein
MPERGLAEVDRPLDLEMASLAERSQIPRQEIPLVTVQMVNREHVGSRPILYSAKLTTPAGSPSHPP